jgi:hypothetical protein
MRLMLSKTGKNSAQQRVNLSTKWMHFEDWRAFLTRSTDDFARVLLCGLDATSELEIMAFFRFLLLSQRQEDFLMIPLTSKRPAMQLRYA